MKEKLIRTLQRWATTILSPSLDVVNWKVENSLARIEALAKANEAQRHQLQDLMTAVLFGRWKETPDLLFSRNELGYWLNFKGLFGEGVEVGVYRGEYSALLLQSWKGARVYSVDPWLEFPPDEYTDVCNLSMRDQESNYQTTTNRLGHFGNRSVVLRQTSKDAAKRFPDSSLDFVFIDAQHHYEAVKEDIELWAAKVRPGGVIGGHDYLNGRIESGEYGVKRAVDEWCGNFGHKASITCDDPFPSWFVQKPH